MYQVSIALEFKLTESGWSATVGERASQHHITINLIIKHKLLVLKLRIIFGSVNCCKSLQEEQVPDEFQCEQCYGDAHFEFRFSAHYF